MSENQKDYKDDFSDETGTNTTSNVDSPTKKGESAAVRRKKKRMTSASPSTSTTTTTTNNNNNNNNNVKHDDDDESSTTTTTSSLQVKNQRQQQPALKDDSMNEIPSTTKQQVQHKTPQVISATTALDAADSNSGTPVPYTAIDDSKNQNNHSSTLTAGTDDDDDDDDQDANNRQLNPNNLTPMTKNLQGEEEHPLNDTGTLQTTGPAPRSRPSFLLAAETNNNNNSNNNPKSSSSFFSIVSSLGFSSQQQGKSNNNTIIVGTKDQQQPPKDTTILLEHLSEEIISAIDYSFQSLSRENFETRKSHAYRSYLLRPASMQYSLEDDGKHHSFSPPRPHFKEPREPEAVNDHPIFVKPLVCSVGDVQSVLFRSGVHRIPPMPRLLKFIHKAVRHVQMKEKKRMEDFEVEQKVEREKELQLIAKIANSKSARRRSALKPNIASVKDFVSPLTLFQTDALLQNTIGFYCRDLNSIHLTCEICLLIAEQMERASNVGCWEDPHEVKRRILESQNSSSSSSWNVLSGDHINKNNDQDDRVSSPGDDRIGFQVRRRASAVSIVSDSDEDDGKTKTGNVFQTADGGSANALRGVSTALMQFKRSLNLSRMKAKQEDPSSPMLMNADKNNSETKPSASEFSKVAQTAATTITPQHSSLLALKMVKVKKMQLQLQQELAQKENKKKSKKLKKMVKKDSFTFGAQPNAVMICDLEKGAGTLSPPSASGSSSAASSSESEHDEAQEKAQIVAEEEAIANEVGLTAGGGGRSIIPYRQQRGKLLLVRRRSSLLNDSETNEDDEASFGGGEEEDEDDSYYFEDGLHSSGNQQIRRRSSLMMMNNNNNARHHHRFAVGDVNLALDDPTDAFGEKFDDIVVTSEDVRDRLREIVKGAVKDLKKQRQHCSEWMNDQGIDKRGKLKTAAVPSFVAGNAASQYSANRSAVNRPSLSHGSGASGTSRGGSPTGSETNLSVNSKNNNSNNNNKSKMPKEPLTAQERHAQQVMEQLQQIQERQQRQQQSTKHVSMADADRKNNINAETTTTTPSPALHPFTESNLLHNLNYGDDQENGLTKSMTFGSFALSSLRRVSSVNSLEESALRPPKIWTRYGPVSPVIKTGSHIEVATLNFYRHADQEQRKTDERTQRHEELFAQLARSHNRSKRRGSSVTIDKSPPSLLEANKTHATSSRGVWSTSASLFARKPSNAHAANTTTTTANSSSNAAPRPPSTTTLFDDVAEEENQLNESRHVTFDRAASRRPLWTKERNIEAPPEVLSARERDSFCRHVAMMRSRPPREPPRDFFLKNTVNSKGLLVPTRPTSARSISTSLVVAKK